MIPFILLKAKRSKSKKYEDTETFSLMENKAASNTPTRGFADNKKDHSWHAHPKQRGTTRHSTNEAFRYH
jgi:hypothetical protein